MLAWSAHLEDNQAANTLQASDIVFGDCMDCYNNNDYVIGYCSNYYNSHTPDLIVCFKKYNYYVELINYCCEFQIDFMDLRF